MTEHPSTSGDGPALGGRSLTQILSEASRAPTKIVGSLYSSLQITDQLVDEAEPE